jgi:hypothetical protein
MYDVEFAEEFYPNLHTQAVSMLKISCILEVDQHRDSVDRLNENTVVRRGKDECN